MILLVLLVDCVVGLALLGSLRWLRRQSGDIGFVVTLGVAVRAVLGLGLFWVSYLNLPILRSLQLGNGFWSVMIDATQYHAVASRAVESGLSSIAPGSASPFYTKLLSLWMRAVGMGPAAGLFLNICVFVGVCMLLVRLFRPTGQRRTDLPLLVVLLALSFLPGLIINATQPLKDDVFLALILLMCVAARALFRSMVGANGGVQWGAWGVGLAALVAIMYGVAGIRGYYAIIAWACFIVSLPAIVLLPPRRHTVARTTAAVLVPVAVWLGYWAGSGSYYWPNAADPEQVALESQADDRRLSPSTTFGEVSRLIDTARRGFVTSPGDTSLAPVSEVHPDPGGVVERSRLTALVIGVCAVVVPISVLKAVSIVQFDGGRGLLPISDIDTALMDLSLVALCWLTVRRRHLIGRDGGFVFFVLVLAVTTTALLSYVVTNFGTMFRLRYMAVAPLWTLALAIRPKLSSCAPEASVR
ncbi:MAG: hypothetical protein ABL961_08605 [Vicinamibacterales bacterium]